MPIIDLVVNIGDTAERVWNNHGEDFASVTPSEDPAQNKIDGRTGRDDDTCDLEHGGSVALFRHSGQSGCTAF